MCAFACDENYRPVAHSRGPGNTFSSDAKCISGKWYHAECQCDDVCVPGECCRHCLGGKDGISDSADGCAADKCEFGIDEDCPRSYPNICKVPKNLKEFNDKFYNDKTSRSFFLQLFSF